MESLNELNQPQLNWFSMTISERARETKDASLAPSELSRAEMMSGEKLEKGRDGDRRIHRYIDG